MSNNFTFISIRSIADEHLLKTNTFDPLEKCIFVVFSARTVVVRQCHRLPICFLTSDLTIRNKNQRTLIVRRAGLSSLKMRSESVVYYVAKMKKAKLCSLEKSCLSRRARVEISPNR